MSKTSKKITEFNLTKLFPSLVTMAGICVGLSSLRYALEGRWELAVSMVLVATLLDAVDGTLARALKATSTFGAHLDSLSDFINFGFTPAFLLYLWSTQDASRFGWSAVLFFTVCCAIRLARFNTDLEEDNDPPDWKLKFFKGVPSPAGALMCLGPLMVTFSASAVHVPPALLTFVKNPAFLITYTVLVAVLMASKLPTYSLKKVLVRKAYASLFLMFGAGCIALAIIEPWLTVLSVGALYIVLMPISAIHYSKLAKNA